MFHNEQVAMRSLQKSSLNSCCRDGFQTVAAVTGIDEPEPSVLITLTDRARFNGHSKFSKGVDNRSGLRVGDGIMEVPIG